MRISVVISTFNSPVWLEKVLWGYQCQIHQDFELVIADDGSDSKTRQVLERIHTDSGMRINHVWQQDRGFRKCRILNKAIVAAAEKYIVFTDGDCIPRNDFLQVHAMHAAPGYYLSGSYFKLPISTSEAITEDDIVSGRCFDLQWLKQNGLKPGRKHRKLATTRRSALWLNRLTPTRCNLKGSNASAWKADLMKVNGFDERMGWGGEDRELGIRLRNIGVKPRHVRYNAICVHLDHSRAYRDPQVVAANKNLRIESQKKRLITTSHGIAQLQCSDHQNASFPERRLMNNPG